MENKYYIPELKEFFVGFEYEYITVNDEFVKNIYGSDKPEDTEQMDIGLIKRILKENIGEIRTKYLDKDDIESIGFKNIKDNLYKSIKTYLGVSTGDDKKLCILMNAQDICIYYLSNRGEEYIKYEGQCKNLSKLKMYLEDIGV